MPKRDEMLRAMQARGKEPNDPLTWGDYLAAVEAGDAPADTSAPAGDDAKAARAAELRRELAELETA